MSYKSFNINALKNKNEDINYLSPNRFKVVIDRLTKPNLDYTVVEIGVPDISTTSPEVGGGITKLKNFLEADVLEYGQLNMRFLVDENMDNYIEIHDWLLGVVSNKDLPNDGKQRDISLLIYNSHNVLSRKITYRDCLPITLGNIEFSTASDGNEVSSCNITFNFRYFEIE